MRIVITTLLWKRHQIFHIWATSIQNIVEAHPAIDFIVVVAGSEHQKSKQLVQSYGFEYIETSNEFLGSKANKRLKYVREFKPDYVWFLGSDDITTPSTLKYYLDMIDQGYQEIAHTDLYLWDAQGKTLVYSCGYLNDRMGETLAVGRMLSGDVLQMLGWELWGNNVQAGMDRHASQRLYGISRSKKTYTLRETGGIIMDIKTDMNITKFKWREQYKPARKTIDKYFNKELCDLIKAIPFTTQP